MPSAAVLLADGLEEIEAVTIIDVLRRAGIDVTTAGLDGTDIDGSHDIDLEADTTLSNIEGDTFDVVILPGGEPGTTHLEEDPRVRKLLKKQYEEGRNVAAICAAPRVLSESGLLDNRQATSHKGVRDKLDTAEYTEEPVAKSGRIVTSRGPGTAIPFALELVRELVGAEKADELADYMHFAPAG